MDALCSGDMVGRPREFDTEAALEATIDVFRECGYEATSFTELVAAMRKNLRGALRAALATLSSA